MFQALLNLFNWKKYSDGEHKRALEAPLCLNKNGYGLANADDQNATVMDIYNRHPPAK